MKREHDEVTGAVVESGASLKARRVAEDVDVDVDLDLDEERAASDDNVSMEPQTASGAITAEYQTTMTLELAPRMQVVIIPASQARQRYSVLEDMQPTFIVAYDTDPGSPRHCRPHSQHSLSLTLTQRNRVYTRD